MPEPLELVDDGHVLALAPAENEVAISEELLAGPRPRPELPPGPYLVAGLGRAGVSAACALAARAHSDLGGVLAWDQSSSPRVVAHAEALARLHVETQLGDEGLASLERSAEIGCVVKSPGIRDDHHLIRMAVARGLPIIDELELGWRLSAGPLVAVTGTNGKSTTCSLIAHVLAAHGLDPLIAGNTEFGPPMSDLAAVHADVVVGEVSSFQLEGCPAIVPEIAVLTNLTRDHLGRHGDMPRYGALKRRLFLREEGVAPLSVVNVDQEFGRTLARDLETRGGQVARYGRHRSADYALERLTWDLGEAHASIATPFGRVQLHTRLPGPHNADNITAAVAMAGQIGIELSAFEAALASAPRMPGRLEAIDVGQPFDVLVDFAHNPDGVRRTLETVRHVVAQRPTGRVQAVVSALALDDPGKRPLMGAIAAELADRVVLTTELMSVHESPTRQIDGLAQGAYRGAAGVEMIVERDAAIWRVIADAQAGDAVVIMGRGAAKDPIAIRCGQTEPFDDRVAARRSLLALRPRWSAAPGGGVASITSDGDLVAQPA